MRWRERVTSSGRRRGASARPADGAPIALKRSDQPDQDPVILDGVNPKHTKIDENDPLRTPLPAPRRRLQRHYLQYEHAGTSTSWSSATSVTFCTYEPDENSTLLWLRSTSMHCLTLQTLLSARSSWRAANCTALGGEMREVLRDRVVSPPRVYPSRRHPDAVNVVLKRVSPTSTVLHVNIEYYHGDAEKHGVARAAAVHSLVSNGHEVPEDGRPRGRSRRRKDEGLNATIQHHKRKPDRVPLSPPDHRRQPSA